MSRSGRGEGYRCFWLESSGPDAARTPTEINKIFSTFSLNLQHAQGASPNRSWPVLIYFPVSSCANLLGPYFGTLLNFTAIGPSFKIKGFYFPGYSSKDAWNYSDCVLIFKCNWYGHTCEEIFPHPKSFSWRVNTCFNHQLFIFGSKINCFIHSLWMATWWLVRVLKR